MARKPKSPQDKFIKVPEYPGGKQALQAFINENLRYPQDALEQHVEGVVSVGYEVDDNGMIISSKIIKGLFPSCNEEALRVVSLLKYGQSFNHGIRVKSQKKVNIYFRLSQRHLENTLQISYTISDKNTNPPKPKPSKSDNSYEIVYTIT